MDIQDQILSTVLDTQGDVKDLKERVGKMESVQEKVYDKLDGFMILINRHEAEISAVRSKLERLEDRLARLEAVSA
jgi:predicted  nucleic acid-binding Zn-ribbon protein